MSEPSDFWGLDSDFKFREARNPILGKNQICESQEIRVWGKIGFLKKPRNPILGKICESQEIRFFGLDSDF